MVRVALIGTALFANFTSTTDVFMVVNAISRTVQICLARLLHLLLRQDLQIMVEGREIHQRHLVLMMQMHIARMLMYVTGAHVAC